MPKPAELPTDVTTEAVLDLYAQFRDEHAAGASSNDITQILDDWFTGQGFPTVLYAPAPRRRRS